MFNTHGLIAVLILALINAKTAVTKNDNYPGLRKPPSISSGSPYDNVLLLKNRNEHARRRFQQRQQQQQHYSFPNDEPLTDEVSGPGFTYKLPIQYQPYTSDDDEIPFAVGPNHPKFYEKIGNTFDSNSKSEPIFTYKNRLAAESDPIYLTSDGYTSIKVKAPMNINPKIIPSVDYSDDVDTENNSNDISKSKDVFMLDDLRKAQRKGQGKAIANELQPPNDVAKKPVDLNSAWVIAIIAGVSAAFTVGLLGIGIGWYTLQKKAKAAADVDYPAYGITGPNKDVSPSSGDRRLAQSAQMYHYQHQKNQIIAMENQNSGEQNGSLSDIETDDENEEGDYTVYECPGLAPTGDMEVKNPLFLDDPTPVKKSTATKPQPLPQQSQQQQQKQQTKPQQSNDNPTTSDPAIKK
ncbi:uncharacterized protein LOC116338821 [Contarinia nasturtii]|uniref:uncharacterized protein LOC116338821 n=1 Tax=Contarinia nasturtii TaxID=265458 RepID=UPI0012D3D9F1|nr:uncharacterized protein LOC116338821 [Contarinia nasturtii]